MATNVTTVFCRFRSYYWHAQCSFPVLGAYESKARIHRSARQAADEVLSEIRAEHGPAVTMRRLSPKLYEITVPKELQG